MNTKTMGHIFLASGVFTMVISVILIILAFTNVIKPSYFDSPVKTQSPAVKDVDQKASGVTGQKNLPPVIPGLDMIPSGILDNAINLSAHLLLMSFIGGFGYKIAKLGASLIRPIVIKSKDKTFDTLQPS